MADQGNDDGRRREGGHWAEMVVGLAIGVALSVAADNWAFLAIGVALGVVFTPRPKVGRVPDGGRGASVTGSARRQGRLGLRPRGPGEKVGS